MSEGVYPSASKTKPDLHTHQPCPPGGMTLEEYRTRAKDMVDYISNYLETIRNRRVFPDVSPGYMAKLIPDECPDKPEAWDDIMADVERVIMPGITHWLSPHNHAYFPALNSFPSLLGDMLADAINNLGFTWASSPACTELETIVMDWLGKMIGLPPVFLHGNKTRKGLGGGCIQTTASDCTFVTLLAARTDAIRRFKATSPDVDDAEINGRLIGYCSDQAHSSVEKAGLIGLVKLRFLPSDENLSLRGDTLQEAVYRDREMGLVPFYVCATLGTTGACAFDNLKEIGPVCQSENIWLHIDAAYAGSAFICPEYRNLMAGIEHANSFAFNPSKWLMVHFDCSAMWVKDATDLHRTFNVEPLYLQHENSGAAIDYMVSCSDKTIALVTLKRQHWQIALSRRFRSLKLWFVLRSFGIEGLQAHIRRGVERAMHFERLVRSDRRFEVTARRHLGMVVFRLEGPNQLTESLLKRLNKQGDIHMVPASLQGKYVIRFTVTSQYTTVEDIERDWKIITDMASKILSDARTSTEDSILEKEEEEEEEEISDELENINGQESERDTEEEDFETFFIKKEETGMKIIDSHAKDNMKTRLNGHLPRDNDEGSIETCDDNDDSVHDNDDDNDERNRKIKKLTTSARKDTKEADDNKNASLKGGQNPALVSDDSAKQTIQNSVGSPPTRSSTFQQATAGTGNSTAERKKHSVTNLKILSQKSAAAKRRDYGLSLLLSNVPMSPKIVNGSFAALFDGEDGKGSSNSLDLSSLTRNWGRDIGEEFIRLSPRKRGKLSSSEKQLSLDYGVLSASNKTCPVRMSLMGSLDSKIDDILELSTTLKGEREKKKQKQGAGVGGERDGGNRDEKKSSGIIIEEIGEKDYSGGGNDGEKMKKKTEVGNELRDGGPKIESVGKGVEGGLGKGGNSGIGKSAEQGEVISSDQRGNGTVVVEKENWDTGHVGDVTNDVITAKTVAVESDPNNTGPRMKSICPLCGRGDV